MKRTVKNSHEPILTSPMTKTCMRESPVAHAAEQPPPTFRRALMILSVLLLSRCAFWDVRGGRNRIPSNAVSSSDISSGLFFILGKICTAGKCWLALLNLQTENGSVKWTIRRASPERGS